MTMGQQQENLCKLQVLSIFLFPPSVLGVHFWSNPSKPYNPIRLELCHGSGQLPKLLAKVSLRFQLICQNITAPTFFAWAGDLCFSSLVHCLGLFSLWPWVGFSCRLLFAKSGLRVIYFVSNKTGQMQS